jgi:hypothetical protein
MSSQGVFMDSGDSGLWFSDDYEEGLGFWESRAKRLHDNMASVIDLTH